MDFLKMEDHSKIDLSRSINMCVCVCVFISMVVILVISDLLIFVKF